MSKPKDSQKHYPQRPNKDAVRRARPARDTSSNNMALLPTIETQHRPVRDVVNTAKTCQTPTATTWHYRTLTSLAYHKNSKGLSEMRLAQLNLSDTNNNMALSDTNTPGLP